MLRASQIEIAKRKTRVSINRIIDAFISGSISTQMAKKSNLDSNTVLPMWVYGNEKEDPFQ
jgi:hypothetical protein